MSTRVTRSSKRSLAEADLDVPEPVVQEKKSTQPAAKDIRSYFGGNPEPSTTPQSGSNSSSPEPQKKKAKITGAPAKKPLASSGRKAPAKKAAAPSSAKAYKDALKAVDKAFAQLTKEYKLNPKGWHGSGVTADDFAETMAKFLPQVKKLQETSVSNAFNLLMYLGDHAYGDLGFTFKASGFGETDKPFQEMDKYMVDLIKLMVEEYPRAVSGEEFELKPSDGDFGDEEKAARDCIGDKQRWNKQERGWVERGRKADLKAMFVARQARRETTEDWAGNALNDLVETRNRIDRYGIGEHFFNKAAIKLAGWKGVEKPALKYGVSK